jgi:hypothetical protein
LTAAASRRPASKLRGIDTVRGDARVFFGATGDHLRQLRLLFRDALRVVRAEHGFSLRVKVSAGVARIPDVIRAPPKTGSRLRKKTKSTRNRDDL